MRDRVKIVSSLQERVDSLRKIERYANDPSVVRVPVYFIEEKLQGFIDFINEDKKRMIDLEKSKFDYIELIIENSEQRIKEDNKIKKDELRNK